MCKDHPPPTCSFCGNKVDQDAEDSRLGKYGLWFCHEDCQDCYTEHDNPYLEPTK